MCFNRLQEMCKIANKASNESTVHTIIDISCEYVFFDSFHEINICVSKDKDCNNLVCALNRPLFVGGMCK